MKYFPAYDLNRVLWGISWANLNMLMATIPVPDYDEDEENDTEQVTHVDPKNEAELKKLLNL